MKTLDAETKDCVDTETEIDSLGFCITDVRTNSLSNEDEWKLQDTETKPDTVHKLEISQVVSVHGMARDELDDVVFDHRCTGAVSWLRRVGSRNLLEIACGNVLVEFASNLEDNIAKVKEESTTEFPVVTNASQIEMEGEQPGIDARDTNVSDTDRTAASSLEKTGAKGKVENVQKSQVDAGRDLNNTDTESGLKHHSAEKPEDIGTRNFYDALIGVLKHIPKTDDVWGPTEDKVRKYLNGEANSTHKCEEIAKASEFSRDQEWREMDNSVEEQQATVGQPVTNSGEETLERSQNDVKALSLDNRENSRVEQAVAENGESAISDQGKKKRKRSSSEISSTAESEPEAKRKLRDDGADSGEGDDSGDTRNEDENRVSGSADVGHIEAECTMEMEKVENDEVVAGKESQNLDEEEATNVEHDEKKEAETSVDAPDCKVEERKRPESAGESNVTADDETAGEQQATELSSHEKSHKKKKKKKKRSSSSSERKERKPDDKKDAAREKVESEEVVPQKRNRKSVSFDESTIEHDLETKTNSKEWRKKVSKFLEVKQKTETPDSFTSALNSASPIAKTKIKKKRDSLDKSPALTPDSKARRRSSSSSSIGKLSPKQDAKSPAASTPSKSSDQSEVSPDSVDGTSVDSAKPQEEAEKQSYTCSTCARVRSNCFSTSLKTTKLDQTAA